MLQREHSAILLTFIKLTFSIKTFVLSIFKWLLKTGFTVIQQSQEKSKVGSVRFPGHIRLYWVFLSRKTYFYISNCVFQAGRSLVIECTVKSLQ